MCEADRQLSGKVSGCDRNCGLIKNGCPALNMLGLELDTAVVANDNRHAFARSKDGRDDAGPRMDSFYGRVETALNLRNS